MKKNWIVSGGAIFVVLIIIFLVLKPQSPDQASIAVVTEKAADMLPLPLLKNVVARYILDSDSVMTWTARKVGGQHNGTIAFSEGALALNISGEMAGKFILDMNTIAVSDLTGDSAQTLLSKLRGEFFDVEKYSTAVFDLKQATLRNGSTYAIVGNLTLKGITKEIRFPATITMTDAGITFEANFSFDRMVWDIGDASGVIDKYIEVGMDVRLIKR